MTDQAEMKNEQDEPEPGPPRMVRRFRFAPGRPPAVSSRAMVATSQPLATWAGLRALECGGNAADAALAAAAVLTVVEPMSTGIGGDCFALVWRDGRIDALDAAGPAPASATNLDDVAQRGPRSVTVPGSVAGWAALSERHGRLGLDRCLAPAIDLAERGFAVAPVTAALWTAAGAPEELLPSPAAGQRVAMGPLAATLHRIAVEGPSGFYHGPVAEAIAAASWLEESDLAAFEPRWVEPLRLNYRGTEVIELPAPTQGVAALEGLGLLERTDPSLASQVHCARLALEDALEHVRDGVDVRHLLDAEYLDERVGDVPRPIVEPPAGTVYLCVVDEDRMAVSFIQSIYMSFGSRVMAPGTGVILQNRGAGFSVQGRIVPGARPYHTIIPGMLMRDGALWGAFGVMGGPIQAQAHMQLVSGLVDEGLDPQAALDRPRFLVAPEGVRLEEGLWPQAAQLEERGERIVRDDNHPTFGGGQAILVDGDALVGGSDARKDGYAGGF
ncbi:MAG: gamma-glutamyltransferase [Solirubrobacteraceae bacterium]|nr:gamma-glutamyltransferase [Solirubrobacteraceae bacterium]